MGVALLLRALASEDLEEKHAKMDELETALSEAKRINSSYQQGCERMGREISCARAQ